MRNEVVLKKFWYGLCENAWFPWQPIVDLRMGVCLQKYSYLSCYVSLTTKLNTKFKLSHRPIIPLLHMQIIYFAYSLIFMKSFKK